MMRGRGRKMSSSKFACVGVEYHRATEAVAVLRNGGFSAFLQIAPSDRRQFDSKYGASWWRRLWRLLLSRGGRYARGEYRLKGYATDSGLDQELGKLLAFVGHVAIAIRMNSAYSSQSQANPNAPYDVMWLADA